MALGPWHILVELWKLLTPLTLLYVTCSTFIGIVIGMLPGLTATMGVALLTGLTFGFPPKDAIIILICVYVGAIYGGSRSAILLNIPGTPANAATCLDGFPMAQRGEAGPAIGLATTSSFLGTVFGLFCLAFFTPLLGKIALQFQSWEFFWLAIFGIVVCGNLTAPTDPLKGWIAGFVGLLVSQVGQEGIAAYPRFSFGFDQMRGGFALIPVLVGVYGIAEVLGVMRETVVPRVMTQIQKVLPRWRDLWQYRRTILRSGIIGVIIGAIPGVGEDVAAWVSYDFAKRGSKKPEEFGKGSREGLIAAETGKQRLHRRGRHPGALPRGPGQRARRGPARRHVAARRTARPAAHDRVPELHLGSHGHVHPGLPGHVGAGTLVGAGPGQGPHGPSPDPDAHRLRLVRHRVLRHQRSASSTSG